MVPCSRRRPKRPLSFFSFLDEIRILCAGCFGKMGAFKRPLYIRPPPPAHLLGNPNLKLNVMMGDFALYGSVREDQENSTTRYPHSHIKSLAWKLANQQHVEDDDDDDVDQHGDDCAYTENDDSDGMFHGLFLMGSKVLTEVELQSPVEENKVFATPIRTPRRSNNSSCASSLKELHVDSFLQGSALNSDSSSLSDAVAMVFPAQCPMPSSMNCVSIQQQRNETPMGSLRLDKQHKTSPRSECITQTAVNDAPLYQGKGQGYGGSIPDDDIFRFSLLKESCGILNEEKSQPSSHSLSDGKRSQLCCSPDGKQCQAFWTDQDCCTARVGSLSSRMAVDASLKQEKNSQEFACRSPEKHTFVHESKNQFSLGSFSNCRSKSNYLMAGRQEKDDGGRRGRSLTDQDFTELRGCIDLGFVFTEDHIPDLRDTLPALEVCYAVAHGAISPVSNLEDSKALTPGSPPVSPWRIASPGDQPQQVKTRLRHWAQAVACNVRQAS
eukprot:c18648_g1_i1 orf=417-1904(-)